MITDSGITVVITVTDSEGVTKVTQNMHGASRNYRYVWDVSTSLSLIPARPRVGK